MEKRCPICQSICPGPARGSGLVQIQTAGASPSPPPFGAFAGPGAGSAPPPCAGGGCEFPEQGLLSFRNVICRRIRTWLPGLSLLHGAAGHSRPARESNAVEEMRALEHCLLE